MMRKGLIGASVLWATFAAMACSPPPAMDDAGVDVVTPTDVRTDTRPPVDSGPAVGAPCTAPGMCGGTTAVCNTFFPAGSCSTRCTSSRACGEGAVCSDALGTSQCYKACSEAGGECGPAEVCALLDSRTMERACIPSCNVMPSAAEPRCNEGLVCEPHIGFCLQPEQAMSIMGADNGGPCDSDDACKSGRCFAERNEDDGRASGFVGGYCFSTARSPALSSYRVGAPIPRSTCPIGSVALPFVIFGISDDGDDGDPALCLRECRADSDCRQGYECERLSAMGMTSTTGFCFIANCLDPMRASMANNGCPTGYSCVRQMVDSAMPQGVCERQAMMPADAGTPPADSGTMGGEDAGTMEDASAGD